MSMKVRRYTTIILLLIICIQYAYGRQHNMPDVSYLHFEPAGLPGSQIKKVLQGKIVTVTTSGGYINVHLTEMFSKSHNKLYWRASYDINDHQHSTVRDIKAKTSSSLDVGTVYLFPGTEYIIDILDGETDTLVKRYNIKRPKLVPEIRCYHQEGSDTVPLHNTNELSISPGEKIAFAVVERADFGRMEVSYTLVNLKTRKSKSGTVRSGFVPLNLAANTAYELRASYVAQQESTGISYIQVAPYWYQRTTVYIIGVLVLVGIGLLTATLVLNVRVRSSQREQQKLQQAAIRLQALLSPHFTFNALSSIQGLMNTGRIEEANNYLQEFSSLLRQTLAKSQHVFNSLDQELEMMRRYLRLEALRFNFSWDMIISPTLDIVVIEIPTLLLQPLIENAIKHGLRGLNDKAQLLITCKETQETDTFSIVIKDNGKWLDKEQSHGYGLSLTNERIQTINKLRKEQFIELTFDKENGTEAILIFHNWLN